MLNQNFLNVLIIVGAKHLYLLVILIALIYILTMPKNKMRELFALLVIALPAAYVVAKLAGLLFYNTRPFVVSNFAPLIFHLPDNGFPSDHTLLVGAVSTIIFFYNKKLGIILWAISILVGISRVLAGVHHTVDIIGSVVIAVVVGIVIYEIYQYILAKITKNYKPKTNNH